MNRTLATFALSAFAASLFSVGCAAPASSEAEEGSSADEIQQHIPDSTYVDLEGDACTTSTSEDESDGMSWSCKGPGPDYRLDLYSGDLRMRASIVGPDGASFEVDPYSHVPEGAYWNTIGPKAEWRTKRGDAAHPYALILRHVFEMPVFDGAGDETGELKKQHYLAVVKIDGAKMCMAAVVEASKNSANANQRARDVAEWVRNLPCSDSVPLITE